MHTLLPLLLLLAQVPFGSELSTRPELAPLPANVASPEAVASATLPPRPRPNPWQDWVLAVDGVTHVPLDMGVEALLETPIRVSLTLGYGWVPSAYSGLLTGIASAASGDALVSAVLDRASYQGRTLRGQLGVRPFRSSGLYLDAGYARLDADTSLELARTGVPALENLGGGYRAHTTMDMWLVEIGERQELWDSLIVAISLGVMGTFDSHTSIVSVDGAPTSPVLGVVAGATDAALKAYGYVPMLTLRLGFDFFAIPRQAAL